MSQGGVCGLGSKYTVDISMCVHICFVNDDEVCVVLKVLFAACSECNPEHSFIQQFLVVFYGIGLEK